MTVKENDYTCGTCKHYCYCYDSDDNHCVITGEFCDEGDTCYHWEEDKDDLTEDEKLGIIGDRKAHEIMETEGYIE